MMLLRRYAAAAIAIGCAASGSGCPGPFDDLAAEETGDVSHPAPRGAPDRDLANACGRGWATDVGLSKIRRHPYVQQVTDHSIDVVWTTSSLANAHVEVWRGASGDQFLAESPSSPIDMEAEPIAFGDAAQDLSARPEGAVRQMVVHLDGLEASSIYCYAVFEGDELLVEPTGVRTAPLPEASAPVRFLAWGDSGDGGQRQMALLEQMYTVEFDLMLVLGDVAYEHGKRSELEANFFGVYHGLTRNFPVYPVAGNHDYATDDAAPLLEAFVLPENGGPEGRERWFSFDYGDVHFVALDTEQLNAAQTRWLDEDLAANDRPWTVVFAHRPPWSSGEHGNSPEFQARFVPILEQHRVALMLAGHDHHYERLHRIGSTHYVVSGGGGRETRDVVETRLTAHAEAVIHFLYVTVDGGRLVLHAIDGVGREFDSLVIERCARRSAKRPHSRSLAGLLQLPPGDVVPYAPRTLRRGCGRLGGVRDLADCSRPGTRHGRRTPRRVAAADA